MNGKVVEKMTSPERYHGKYNNVLFCFYTVCMDNLSSLYVNEFCAFYWGVTVFCAQSLSMCNEPNC